MLGDAGIVAREGDVDDWRDALDRVLGTPGIRSELSERGIRRVHEHFTWRHAAAAHLRFFSELT